MSRRLPLLAAAGVALAGAVAVLLLGGDPATVVATPSPVLATPSPDPSPSPSPTTGEVRTAPPERVVIPAVGVDLPVLPIVPADGVIDPPTVAEAYWIRDYGLPGTDATNTVYLVAHSSLRTEAAFNPLLDVEHQESVLAPGDEVLVTTAEGVLRYEVTGSTRYGKRQLPGASEVWAIDPGVLHLITCFQEDGLATAEDNLVVTARLVAGFPDP